MASYIKADHTFDLENLHIYKSSHSKKLLSKDVLHAFIEAILIEEIGFNKLLMAEADKITYVLEHNPTISDLLILSHDLESTIRILLMKEMLRQKELRDLQKQSKLIK
jgi:hypothetical protein